MGPQVSCVFPVISSHGEAWFIWYRWAGGSSIRKLTTRTESHVVVEGEREDLVQINQGYARFVGAISIWQGGGVEYQAK